MEEITEEVEVETRAAEEAHHLEEWGFKKAKPCIRIS